MSTTAGLRNVTYDDRDTDHFKYQGFWFLTGSWNASSVGESGTLSSTNDLNANVTFTFPTPAVGFYYYGIPRSNGGSYGICIDCDPNNRVFLPIDGVNATDNGQNPPVVLFSMKFKGAGVHEIILRNQADSRFPNGNSQLTLDKFDLEIVDPSVGPASSSSSSSSSSQTSAPSTSSPVANPSTSSSSTPIGAIVGGVLGGLAAILFVLLLLFWLRMRRRKAALAQSESQESGTYHQQPYTDHASPDPSSFVQPFNYPSMQESGSTSLGAPVSVGYNSGKGARGRHPQFQPSISTFSDATSAAQTSSSALTTFSSSNPPASNAGSSGPRREQDGGPLPLPEEDEEPEDTLPPEYGAVFAARRATVRGAANSAQGGEVPGSSGGALSPVRHKS